MKFYKRHMKRPILLLTLCLVCVALGGCSDQQVRDALIDMGYMPGPTEEPTQEPARLATLPPLELEAHLFAGETETPGPQQATPEPSPEPEGETSQPEPVPAPTPEPGAETPAPSPTPESGQDTGGAGFEGEEAEPASTPEGEASSGEASGQAVESAGAAPEEPSLDTDARLDAPSQSALSEAE